MNKERKYLCLWIFYIYVTIIQCDELASCYNQPPESCPNNQCKCILTDESSIFCCRTRSYDDLFRNIMCSGTKLPAIKALHIYNMTADRFDFGKFSNQLNHLISLSITSSSVNRLFGRLEHTHQITCLNFSNNAFGTEWPLNELQVLENLKTLAMLDFSHTNISKLPIIKNEVPKFWIDLSYNNNTQCDSLLELMGSVKSSQNKQLLFKNTNDTFCNTTLSFNWFNSTEILAFDQIKIIDKLNTQCPSGCKCKWHGYEMISDKNVLNTVEVDCSNNKLSYLPINLPENTVVLNVTNNNITNIDALVLVDSYKDLRFFYADKNKVSSILALEGSRFMDNYAVLSLKSNQLKSIPMYILENSFTRSFEGHLVNLGGNQLYCDCSTAQYLKVWLEANHKHIPDYREIQCENLRYKVVDLDCEIVCVTQTDWTDYMYYVIAAEISALLLLIGKVSYDYYVFKTAGYLPWPASKMPKLPCDWVFE
ncbi:protein halfway isoform X2 [Daktulosphaira vitifoliae]|uniref:protein halfway isoform X2 n=1 Tax=Daktulosphaira vitifoliae TaxID=58002 RepID=UPI0021AB0248|nr:protein halfway isoform X2 [Daktulosphaira vitifoliae]